MNAELEHVRHEWEESHRRFTADADDPRRGGRLLEQFELVTAELRRRVGQTFTLDELARAYAEADRWAPEAIAVTDPPAGWAGTVSLVQGAAFHAYSRGAVDYRP